MKRFKVVRDCTFQGRYWLKGTVSEFEDTVAVPRHFEPTIDLLNKKDKPAKEDQIPFSQMHNNRKPVSGFAAGAVETDPKVPTTAGSKSEQKEGDPKGKPEAEKKAKAGKKANLKKK